ncbi:MAG: heavy-metal-associated domain-containing protein [Ignavibacteriae bacterium]|nr:heavy-metal-associated domain-containing protein [Ignavibacteriota bacterium]
MKKQLLLNAVLFLLTAFLFTTVASAQEQDTTIKEAKIKTSAVCEHCKARIEKAVNKLDGIESANLDTETKVLSVKYHSDILTLASIKTAINKSGYNADDMAADKEAFEKLPNCCKTNKCDHEHK